MQEDKESEKYKLEREWLYAAILYNNLIDKYLQESEKAKKFLEFSKSLAQSSDSLITKVFQNNLTISRSSSSPRNSFNKIIFSFGALIKS